MPQDISPRNDRYEFKYPSLWTSRESIFLMSVLTLLDMTM